MTTTRIQRMRVPVGFAYALLFLYFSAPRPPLFYPGLIIAASGLAVRFWASGYLNKGRELAMAGPYAWTRNPLYFGSFLMGLGFTIAGSKPWLMALFPLLFFLIYWPVMQREERELTGAFGTSYQTYRSEVGLFLPWRSSGIAATGSSNPTVDGNFQWSKVIFNREYKAVIGFIFIAALIWGKMLWH